nr:MAG TPA: hypothetical protein [Caudoviricetes sp.]
MTIKHKALTNHRECFSYAHFERRWCRAVLNHTDIAI